MIKMFTLKVASIYLDLLCSVFEVTISTWVSYSFMISSKIGLFLVLMLKVVSYSKIIMNYEYYWKMVTLLPSLRLQISN